MLIGRATNTVPDDEELTLNLKTKNRYLLIQQATKEFWDRWSEEITPMHIIRQKWHLERRNLSAGDIVLVHDKNPIKGKYTLAKVDEVHYSRDGLVRSCSVSYRIPKKSDRIDQYTGGRLVQLKRSIQRLTLLLKTEDQNVQLMVDDGQVVSCDQSKSIASQN